MPDQPEQAFSVYTQALIADIESQPEAEVATLFWGGGTPSLLPIPEFERITQVLARKFHFTSDLEHTVEVNPGTVTEEKLERYLSSGVNRLSIGAQSFHSEHLELVGRVHTAAEIENTFQVARRSGFGNLSLDLIYGFPTQTVEQWDETLSRALALGPDHLSVYQLTIEPSTRLESQLARGELALPPEDDLTAMDDRAELLLSGAGFERYEVSNWSREGRRCRHNLRYWDDSPYLGLGCGGVSFLRGWRIERIKAPAYYQKAIQQGRSPVVFAERRGLDGALKDHLMMGLRVKGGVNWKHLSQRYPGLDRAQLQTFFERLPAAWWRVTPEGYELTRQGWDFHSEVTMELMDVMFSF